jgi:hypothetical protein
MKKLWFKKSVLVVAMFGVVLAFAEPVVHAATQHPHPYYKDTWHYGTNGKHGWSHYYLEAPVRLGSASSVKNIYGFVKSQKTSNYGWARSDAKKNPWDLRLDAFYGWYEF